MKRKNKSKIDQDDLELCAKKIYYYSGRLCKFVNHRDEELRLWSLEKIDNIISHDLVDTVRRALNDNDELVRTSAVEVLGSWNDKKSIGNFLGKLADKKWLVRVAAAEGLARMNVTQAIETIKERLMSAGKEEMYGLYFSLALFGKKKYFEYFLKGLSESHYRIRCATANRVLDLINPSNKNRIESLLRKALSKEKSLAAREAMQCALDDMAR